MRLLSIKGNVAYQFWFFEGYVSGLPMLHRISLGCFGRHIPTCSLTTLLFSELGGKFHIIIAPGTKLGGAVAGDDTDAALDL